MSFGIRPAKILMLFYEKIWLECCDHLSAFTINDIRYELNEDAMWLEILVRKPNRSMNIQTGAILSVGLKFYYEYDFGTTTHLTLRVLSEQKAAIKDKSIQILARNDQPRISCEVCGEFATQVCRKCIHRGEGRLCEKCAKEHSCGRDMFLPVVNSPRVGICGYTGD